MTDTTPLRTPLYDKHVALGAKMVPFAGYEMPVQYADGILAEHRAVRENVGIFDVSHMGEFEVTGPDRNAFVNRMACNDVAAIGPGDVQYSAILNEDGTFVDDCTIYRYDDKIMLVVNAANRAKVWDHIVTHKKGANIRLKDISDAVGLLAIQGPRTEEVLGSLAGLPLDEIEYYRHATGQIAKRECFISRTGYTGEDGFEVYCRARDTVPLWEAVVAAGATPIGLGARDSLRLEMGYALYGNEIDDTVSPLEAGLAWIVKLEKGTRFLGSAALRAERERGVTRKLVGFKLLERGIPRHGYPVSAGGRQADIVRSGGQSPSLGIPIGTTFLPPAYAGVGSQFEVDCRGKLVPAEVVKRPFWTHGTVKKR